MTNCSSTSAPDAASSKERKPPRRAELGDEYLDAFDPLPREDYKLDEIFDETYSDLETFVDFLEEIQRLDVTHDDKLKSLLKLLNKDAVLKKQRVIIFTEFMTTARYLKNELQAAGIDGVDEIDSASNRDRADVIREFAPYYNESSNGQLEAEGRQEIRILISADVLSEGLNLQDATRLINYDLHWNPVRRSSGSSFVPWQGRLLELPSPGRAGSSASTLSTRGFQNLAYLKSAGIDGKKLLKPEDDFDALRDVLHTCEGEATPLEKLHLEYQELLKENLALDQFLDTVPLRLFSGKEHPKPGTRSLFFCYSLPTEDKSRPPELAWYGDATRTGWYLYALEDAAVVDDPARIAEFIRSTPKTSRLAAIEKPTLREIRLKIERHIKNTYL